MKKREKMRSLKNWKKVVRLKWKSRKRVKPSKRMNSLQKTSNKFKRMIYRRNIKTLQTKRKMISSATNSTPHLELGART
jgi:hypothetical protein